ncbi:hypothetical protein C8R43DRAFT_1124518 [Mycena crocata]|nr:hypothetical protein C8R43DRAFT_1124518 [Mycena crocata]
MNFLLLAALTAVSILPSLTGAQSVEYCTGTGLAGICKTASTPAGTCVNVDLAVNDQTKSAEVTSGQNCVFWENADCHGGHTTQLDGGIRNFGDVCGGWQNRISSFKCCSGDASSTWCAGSTPKCA